MEGKPFRLKARGSRLEAKARVLEPSVIFKEIEEQPPLMRPNAARAYRGMEADWVLKFANAKPERSDKVSVYFNVEPHDIRMVTGSVSLRKYPELEKLPVGAPVRVCGRIQKADTLFIELEIRDMKFNT